MSNALTNKNIKPFEGIKLRYRVMGFDRYNMIATAHKNMEGNWFVRWEDGRFSESGSCSGVTDNEIHSCWEVVSSPSASENSSCSTNLKERNMAPDATICYNCNGKLKEPYPGLKHCPKCEP